MTAITLIAVVGLTIVLVGIRWRLSGTRKNKKCRRGRHEWSQTPIQGVGDFSLTMRCVNCGAAYTRHRGF